MTSPTTPPRPPKAKKFKSGDLIAGKYRIEKLLAEGGMGQVFVAVQEPIGRQVALKILRKALAADEESIQRFFREAVTVSKLHHPNTITVLDYGEHDDGTIFITMEFLVGEDLGTIFLREGRLAPERVVSIAFQIASALEEAHHKNVLHRDLKPPNIFMSQIKGKGEVVKVIDFGVAKLLDAPEEERVTRIGFVCGTAEYMAPELSSGAELDGRTDLYALGTMMWELLEGRLPFRGANAMTTALLHQAEDIPSLSDHVPPALAEFVYRAMAKDPDDRPATAEAFIEELTAASMKAGLSITGSMPSMTPAPKPVVLDKKPPTSDQMESIAFEETLPVTPSTPVPASSVQARTHEPPVEAPKAEETSPPAAPTPTPAAVAPPSSEARAKGRFVAMALIAVLLLVLVGVGAMVLFGDKTQEPGAAPPVEIGAAKPTLEIISDQEGVKIFRGTESIGKTPLKIQGEPGEKVWLSLQKAGFEPARLEETFPKEGNSRLKVVMKPTEKIFVHILSNPERAEVVRDGKVVGKTPHAFKLDKDTRPFKVKVRADRYKSEVLSISPVKGDHSHSVKLKRGRDKKVAPRASKDPGGDVRKNPDAAKEPPKPAKDLKIEAAVPKLNTSKTVDLPKKLPKKKEKPDEFKPVD